MLKFALVSKLTNYIGEVKLELSKVTWPKKNEVIRLTLIVFIISGIVAGFVGGLDFIFTKLLAAVVTK
jgi:preprotein translocase subunit SecE